MPRVDPVEFVLPQDAGRQDDKRVGDVGTGSGFDRFAGGRGLEPVRLQESIHAGAALRRVLGKSRSRHKGDESE